jgi:predicted kinase
MIAAMDTRPHLYVLVAGPPGSGKTTLSAPLATALGLPLIAKDAIKEALMDVLGNPVDLDASRRLGRAAVMSMLAVARTSPGAVMDSTWYPYTLPVLRELPGRLVEVRCVCPAAVAKERYVRRSQDRHAGHLDALRPDEELWNAQNTQPLGIAPLVTVDTTTEVDVPALVAAIRAAADAP